MAAPVATASPEWPQSVHYTTSEPSTPSAVQRPATSLSSPPNHAAPEFLWTPSKSEALGPAAVKLNDKPAPRRWERVPVVPAAQDSRFRTVWKRYMLRPRALTSAAALPSEAAPALLLDFKDRTPERPVKKMRVRHDVFVDQAVVTKWQRRRSSLPSKTFALRRGRSNAGQERGRQSPPPGMMCPWPARPRTSYFMRRNQAAGHLFSLHPTPFDIPDQRPSP
jgi:hypothetical protein